MKSTLIENKVFVSDEKLSNTLSNKGNFGRLSRNKLELSLVEALYLMEKDKITIVSRNKELSYEEFIKKATKSNKRFLLQYHVYKNLRSKGHITKTALKYGADFRVYAKGVKPGKGHALYIVFCVNENDKFSWKQFSSMMRVSHSVRKDMIIAIVDDETDVTYYTCGWKKL